MNPQPPATEELPERAWITLRPDGGLTHIALFEKYADTPSVEYIPLTTAQRLVAESRAKAFEEAAEIDKSGSIGAYIRYLKLAEEARTRGEGKI